jgi:hypothetical protein
MNSSFGRSPEAACPPSGLFSRIFHPRIIHLTIAVLVFATLGALALRGGSEPISADRPAAKSSEGPAATSPAAAKQNRVLENYGQIPLSFEPNAGQTDARVKFLSRGPGYTVFLTNDEAVLALSGSNKRKQGSSAENALPLAGFREISSPRPEPGRTTAVLRMRLIDANKNAQVAGVDQLPGTTNYFQGKDPHNWRTNVVNYRKVSYRDVYPGIDLVYYGNQRQLEYDFVVAPGSDPAAIKVSFAGAPKVRLDGQTGDLVLSTAKGDVRFHKPVAYQTEGEQSSADDGKRLVDSSFVLDAKNRVSFQLGSYDHGKALVIDPTLGYSTYLGGTGNDYATSLVVDSTGNAYVTGYTASANFPTTAGSFQTSCGGGTACSSTHINAFVTKLNSTGTALVYSTYLGGSAKDYGYGIAIDASGDAFIAGTTFSNDFPTTAGAYQTACGGGTCADGDVFIAELNSTGSGLVYSTLLGGKSANQANAIVVDSSGNAYFTGYTRSANYPVTPGVFQGLCGSCKTGFVDSYVTKLNSTGTALVYSTFLGGNNADVGYAIALDSSENVYVTGYTYSTNFPTTPGAFQTTLGGPTSAFVTKINSTASAKIYSTYLNGSATGTSACAACGSAITADAEGNAYVAGLTWETNFPTTTGAYQTTFGGGFHDAFVTKFSSTGTLIYSTYIGGSGDDGATSILVDSNGTAYIKGNTFSSNFPTTPGAFSTTFTAGLNSEAFVLLLNPSGSALDYSTYLGGAAGSEYGLATTMLALDNEVPPNIYVTGYTNSTTYPTTAGAYQTKRSGAYDGFVTKFAPSPNVGLSPGLNFGNQNDGTSSAPLTITVTNTGNSTLTVSSVGISGANSKDFSQTNTCTSGGVAPQSTCAIKVVFSPTTTGTENATVTVTDNAPDSPESTTLTGVGVGAGPAVTLSPTSLTFATQLVGTSSAPQNVTLTNTGSGTLSITSIATTGDFSQTNNCAATIAVGASCTITVTFTPTTINTRTGTVAVTDNAPASPQTVTLTGTGTYVSWTPASLTFGAQTVGTSSAPQTITFTNNATTALTIKSVVITGTDNKDFTQTDNCGTSLPRKSSCAINVTFTPTATGLRTAFVTVSDYLGGNSTQNISLSGTGQ